ncbi:hypothetical protein GCM10027089_57350 [Nocardia thraciensis]
MNPVELPGRDGRGVDIGRINRIDGHSVPPGPVRPDTLSWARIHRPSGSVRHDVGSVAGRTTWTAEREEGSWGKGRRMSCRGCPSWYRAA